MPYSIISKVYLMLFLVFLLYCGSLRIICRSVSSNTSTNKLPATIAVFGSAGAQWPLCQLSPTERRLVHISLLLLVRKHGKTYSHCCICINIIQRYFLNHEGQLIWANILDQSMVIIPGLGYVVMQIEILHDFDPILFNIIILFKTVIFPNEAELIRLRCIS